MTRSRSETALAVRINPKSRATAFRHARARRVPAQPSQKPPVAKCHSWLRVAHAFLRRHLHHGEDLERCARDLNLTLRTARELVKEADRVHDLRGGRRSGSAKVPLSPGSIAQREIADTIAAKLIRIAQHNRQEVRHALENYVTLVHKDGKLNFTNPNYALRIRSIIWMVRKLRIPQLKVGCLGFRVNGHEAHLGSKLRALGLPADHPIRYVQAPNQHSAAGLHHLAVEFVWEPDGKRSEAFRFVLAMAAIAKIWQPAARASKCNG